MPEHICSLCNFTTKLTANYTRHLTTNKHTKLYNSVKTNDTINNKKEYTPAQNQHKSHLDQHKTSTNQHKSNLDQHKTSTKPAQTIDNILFCDFCGKKFKTKDNKTRHIRKYCVNNKSITNGEAELLKDLLMEQKEMFNQERKELYKQIETLLSKVGNTTNIQSNIKNTINLNSYGNEDMSHITDKLKSELIKIPYAMIPKMIEAVHFNDNKPENKNISLTNIRDNKIKIFSDNKWIYKDKDETINDLVDGKYYILDNHFMFQEKTKNIDNDSKTNYIKFREFFNDDDKDLVAKLKRQCELVLLNNR
jgi:hypothetical protein